MNLEMLTTLLEQARAEAERLKRLRDEHETALQSHKEQRNYYAARLLDFYDIAQGLERAIDINKEMLDGTSPADRDE